MNYTSCKTGSSAPFLPIPVVIGVCLCILAVTAGLLALSSCATTPEAVIREEHMQGGLSNAVVALRSATPYLPQPVGGVVEALLAAATAGLAAWNAHLHQSVQSLKTAPRKGRG